MTDKEKFERFGEGCRPEVESTPSGPAMGDLREEFLRARAASGFTHEPIRPTATAAQIREWWERINQIRREVNAAGLSFEASIHQPGPEPWKKQGPVAELYGRPLAWPDETEKARELYELPRSGMSIKAAQEAIEKQLASSPDYFGINGPAPSEWLARQTPGLDEAPSLMEERRHRYHFPELVDTLPDGVMRVEISIPDGEPRQQIRFHSSLSEQELLTMLEETKALSEVPPLGRLPTEAMIKTLEAAGQKVLPYLLEDVFIPSCPVIGKQPPEDMGLSEMEI